MVVRVVRDVPIRVGWFPVYCSGQSVVAACHQDIQECEPPLFLFLNCELHVSEDLVEACVERLQAVLSMGPDDEGIIHIPQPEAELEWGSVHGLLL